MEDIDSIIAEVQPSEAAVDLCLRGDLMSEYDLLSERIERIGDWQQSSMSDEDPRTALRARLTELREEMATSTRTFRFQNIGDKPMSDLLAKHPSPKNEEGIEEYAWNPQTYPAALVAASAVEPTMSEAQALRLFGKLNLDQRNELFAAAIRANTRTVDIPFFAAASAPAANTEQN